MRLQKHLSTLSEPTDLASPAFYSDVSEQQ